MLSRFVSRLSASATSLIALFIAVPLAQGAPRAFEQVSPPDKSFANIDEAVEGAFKFTVSDDGNALGYCNAGAGGAQVGTFCGDYISERSISGWRSRVIAPAACGQDLDASEVTFGGQKTLALSNNLDYAVIGQPETALCGVDPLDAEAPLPGNNLYRESLLTTAPAFELLTSMISYSSGGRSFNTPNGRYGGGSTDGGHLVFSSTGDQSHEGLPVDGTKRLFEWDNGSIHLVSKDIANLPFVADSSLAGNPVPAESRTKGYGGVSADGERIFFQSPVDASDELCAAANCEIYLREGGAVTHLVSEQECNPACSNGTAPDIFQWANPAGDRVLFRSKGKLVNEDPSTSASGSIDLYMYRHPDDASASPPPSDPHNLALLSTDSEPADGTNASVLGVLGLSDDGDTVYFVASGQLTPGKSLAAGPKVYRWSWSGGSPTVEYLGTLDSAFDEYLWQYTGTNPRTLIKRVSADGEHLLLDSIVPLSSNDEDLTRDVFRWSEPTGWICLSCQSPGEISEGESSIKALSRPKLPDGPAALQNGQTQNADPVRVSSDDGDRVFFTSMDRLTGDDVNTAQDVYEWSEGSVTLISGGAGSTPSKLVGSSRTGDDVFFITSDRLVGWDTDNLADVYDARIGGGFDEPLPPVPLCEGNECRPPAVPGPVGACSGTCVFDGPPNESSQSRSCRKGFKRVTVKKATICKKTRMQHKKSRRHAIQKGG